MKPKKITIKIIFAFMFLIIFTHVSIFFIMRTLKIEQAKKDNEYYKKITLFAFQEFIDKRFKPYSLDEVKNNIYYENTLSDISDIHNLNVVITDKNNNILMQPQDVKSHDYYQNIINEEKDNIDKLRRPFPIQIPFFTEKKEQGYIYLFHEYDSASSDTLFNFLLSAVFLINILLLIFIARKLTKPLDKFDKAIRAISEGDFSSRIDINSHDEFKQLAETINTMACRIKKSIAEQKESSANISHELRSPLTRIRVAVQILKDINAEKCIESETYFESIDKEIEGMDLMIDGILKYYRIDNDSSQAIEQIDIIDLLKNELSKQSNYFDLLNIKSVNKIELDSYKVKIMPSIRSIFENIISNASKYTVKDGNFTVSAVEDNNDLKITFENSIEKDSEIDLEKIFQPFYRGNNIDDVKGSGMGLAIAKKISDLNNCDLTIDVVDDVFRVVLVVK
ncbi:MAG: HAMP domain-containing sensor histidine kinase [Candidatus Delongbacteria bacterium]|jgi:signal transduction histidine kinase|nr:HAMP domain-containing sensor histidine kinase [Candidatus Delongbacteria bacterium]